MLLNNQEITEEIKEEIKKYLETNDNENTTIQNLWDATKAVLREKFTAIQAYLKKQEKSQINNLTLHLKELEKEEQKSILQRHLQTQWIIQQKPIRQKKNNQIINNQHPTHIRTTFTHKNLQNYT